VKSAARGLSLLEVVISIGILFLVMLLLLNLATTSIWGTREGGERLAAESHALSVAETYRGQSFTSYALDQDIALPAYTEDGTRFETTLKATAVPGYPADRLRQLAITIKWTSTRGPQEATLALYANPILR
jgi:hypothetical protein